MKRKLAAALMAVTIIGMTGCQKNPDSSIVKNKDFDNMLDVAQDTESGVSNVGDMAGNYDTYKTTIEDESLGVTVNVDAKVDIPSTDKMSVIRVQQKEITQELLDKVSDTLLAGETLYDGSVFKEPTKKSIEQEIQTYKDSMANLERNNEGYSEEDIEAYRQEYRQMIDELEEQYDAAPADSRLKEHPSDGKIHTVQEYLKKEPDSVWYLWQKALNANGAVYYGVNDGADGTYVSLYAQNNADYGNCLRYRSSKAGYMQVDIVTIDDRLGGVSYGVWKADEEPEADMFLFYIDVDSLKEMENETATLPLTEARQQADDFLKTLGLTDYVCNDGDLYCELVDTGNRDGEMGYRREYIFQYFRSVDGVQVDNYGTSKFAEGWQGDTYQKQEWPPERAVVYVNDDGIAGFDYMAPLEITETVVDTASMKPFDEVKRTFEQMIVVTQAMDRVKVDIKVDRVVLRYTRISEENRFDTGLLVPVWDFMGTKQIDYGDVKSENEYGSLLSINAIDGSVIDKKLGY